RRGEKTPPASKTHRQPNPYRLRLRRRSVAGEPAGGRGQAVDHRHRAGDRPAFFARRQADRFYRGVRRQPGYLRDAGHGRWAAPICIAKLADSSIVKVPRKDSNDFNPMWIEDRVYFLSDRNGPVTLFAYDPATRKVTQVLKNNGLDIQSASAGPGAIVYEQF